MLVVSTALECSHARVCLLHQDERRRTTTTTMTGCLCACSSSSTNGLWCEHTVVKSSDLYQCMSRLVRTNFKCIAARRLLFIVAFWCCSRLTGFSSRIFDSRRATSSISCFTIGINLPRNAHVASPRTRRLKRRKISRVMVKRFPFARSSQQSNLAQPSNSSQTKAKHQAKPIEGARSSTSFLDFISSREATATPAAAQEAPFAR